MLLPPFFFLVHKMKALIILFLIAALFEVSGCQQKATDDSAYVSESDSVGSSIDDINIDEELDMTDLDSLDSDIDAVSEIE